MPWWPNAFYSPKQHRLNRQKKHHHCSSLRSGTSSPQFSDLPSSPGSSEFSLVLPQPLPRPDGSPKRNFNSPAPIPIPANPNLNSILADFPLPSPKEAVIRGVEERDKSDPAAAVTSDGALSNSAIVSRRFSQQDGRKSMEHVDTRSYRKGPQYQAGAERICDTFRLNAPFQSAPTSPLSSPMPSPQRMSTGTLLSSQRICPGRLSIDMSTEMAVAFPSQASPAFTPDASPVHSPAVKSPRWSTRSPALSGPASPLHPKLSLEAPPARRESNVNINNVHPLPLPPGASMPSTPTPVTTKPDLVPMTSQWQKGKLIGRGTFGSVYVATNRETGALCAMKEVELLPDDPKSAESIKQLEQEINVLSNLKHPNIVQYYGSEIVGDRFYIYLEFVHPGSINKYLRDHCGAMTESVVRNFTRHILSGLAYLHSTKTIHRDIKGANLLVDASGVVKLADFGMAKHLTGAAADLSLKGSPYWMAPEVMNAVMQKDSSSDLALAVDIWSLGCTIIEMLNGKPPWSEYEGAAAMFKVMRESPPIPETLSAEGKDFLRCCFRRNPAERPSASTLLEHRFVNNQNQLDVAFNGIKLAEKAQSPRERSPRKSEQVPTSFSTQTQKGKLPYNSSSFTHYSFSPVSLPNDLILKLPT